MTAQQIEMTWSEGWRILAARWLAQARKSDGFLTDQAFAAQLGIPSSTFSALQAGKRSWNGYAARLLAGLRISAGDGLNELLQVLAEEAAESEATP